MALGTLLGIAGEVIRNLAEPKKESKPKEEPPKQETLKEEPKKEEKKYRSGGYVRSADGCAKRGKTRGKMV